MEDQIVDSESFLCEGGDVEQWLEPQNISLCLRLDLSQLSHYISCIVIIVNIYIHARYYLCAHTCVQLRELLKHLNS